MQDKKHKRLTKLIHPLKRLSLLSTSQRSLVPEVVLQEVPEQVANDLISCLPHETAVAIFALLCFKDLISVQLVCKSWRRIASDAALWRQLYVELSWRYPYLSLHRFVSDGVTWHQRFCRATTMANWSTGSVQKIQSFNEHVGRVLSTKLKDRFLVTLGEDNVVILYEYNKDQAQFHHKHTWDFGQSGSTNVKCVDILPEINVMVVAQRGSKCIFYDISKNASDPIQVLRGGNHILFEPESIALDRDHFVLSGRKPSAIFVWEWRKGVRISNRAFDNQAHRVFLSGDHVITISVDGSLHVFHIPSNTMRAIATDLPACCLPCLAYDGSLSLVATPYAARRLHHFEWKPTLASKKAAPKPQPSQSTPTPSAPEDHRASSSSSTSSHLLSFSASMSSFFGHFRSKDVSTKTRPKSAEQSSIRSQQLQRSRLRRQRRHSSYNDFGWECTARTTQYIKNLDTNAPTIPTPDFSKKINLIKSITTTPLGVTSRSVVGVAIAGNRAVMVNRAGDMAIVMLDSGHVSQIRPPPSNRCFEWIENWQADARDNDEDQDGYNFSSTRLAADPRLGIAYGGRNGTVWFFSFNCAAD